MLISRLNLRLVQIGRNAPSPFCLMVRYSACIVSQDVTLPNHISCTIKHLIGDLAEKTPHPQWQKWQKFLDWKYPFYEISSNFGSAGRKATPHSKTGKKFLNWIYPFHAISRSFASAGRKAPPHF